jgi:recombination protein RecT
MTQQSNDLARREQAQAPETRQARPQTVLEVFSSEGFRRQVAAALPRHISVDHMMRIAMTEVRQSVELQKCSPASFMGALLKAAQSGLRPGMFGEGWIIPRWNGKTKSVEAAFQPGYQGLVQLAYRSGEVSDVTTSAVFASDHFLYSLGSDPKIEHQPDLEGERTVEDIIAFYAVIRLTNGGKVMKVMRRAEVDEIRDRFGPRNKAGQTVGPWASDYQPMGEKTVLIQALKFVPKDPERSAQLQAALGAENDAIFGDRLAAQAMGQAARGTTAERVAERLGVASNDDGETEGPGDGPTPAAYQPIEGEVVGAEASQEPSETPAAPHEPPLAASEPAADATFFPIDDEPAAYAGFAVDAGRRAAERAQSRSTAKPISQKQVNLLYTQCTICEVDEKAALHDFLRVAIGVEHVAEIPAVRFDEVLGWVKAQAAPLRGEVA